MNIRDDRMCVIVDKMLDRIMLIEAKLSDMEQNKYLTNTLLSNIERKLGNSYTYIPMQNDTKYMDEAYNLEPFRDILNAPYITKPPLKKRHSF
tara:strand:- start:923 stop:1201 length:279 start_codon:yes stop_codon:yes gene_type:complete